MVTVQRLTRKRKHYGSAVSEAKPFPKSQQLARGERRYRRKVASPKQWQAIIAAKGGACRVCGIPAGLSASTFHHLVPRDRHGDDIADNIVPLCFVCHELVEWQSSFALSLLHDSLTAPERAHVLARLGADGMRRLFGVTT